MRTAVVLVLSGVLFLGACGGDEDDAAGTSAVLTTERTGWQIVIREKLIIAATERSEPIATGTILPGSMLGARRSAPAGRSWTPMRASIPRWSRT